MDDDIRELARQTGCTRELTADEVRDIERKLQEDHLDRVLNGERQ